MNLSAIITRYRTTDNTELELRFKFQRESFEKFYKDLLDSDAQAELECSINVISRGIREVHGDSAQYIRRMIFVKGIRASDDYWRKERLVNVRVPGYIGYTVAVSQEEKIPKFEVKAESLLRFKTRVSFTGGTIPAGWRVDMTVIKSGTFAELSPQLKTIRDTMFPAELTPQNLFGPNLDPATHYEVEIEHIGADRNLSIDAPGAVAQWVYSIVNPHWSQQAAYQDELYRVARIIAPNPAPFRTGEAGLKRLSNQVRAINKNSYYSEIYPPDGYYLTEKTDGVRGIASVDAELCKMITGSGIIVTPLAAAAPVQPTNWADIEEFERSSLDRSQIEAPVGAPRAADTDWLVADGEMVELREGGSVYCVFDVLIWRGHSLAALPFSVRHTYIAPAAEEISRYIPARAKRFKVLTAAALEAEIREVAEAAYPYETDGLILTEPTRGYLATINYKWKPLSHNTIDFLAVKAPANIIGRPPYMIPPGIPGEIYFLFSGVRAQLREQLGLGFLPGYRQMFGIHGHRGESPPDYLPIQFSPSANPHAYIYIYQGTEDINRKVVELRRNSANTAWIFVRVRSDRTAEKRDYGNDYRVAELTYMNYIDPFELADLWRPSLGYFTKTAAGSHIAPNRFRRYAIGLSLMGLDVGERPYVIDQAAGRGADFGRFQAIGARATLFIDIDPAAIAELISRKFDFFAKRHSKVMAARKQQRRGGGGDKSALIDYGAVADELSRLPDQRTGGEHEDKMEGFDAPPNLDDIPRNNMTVHTMVADLKKTTGLTAAVARFGAAAAGVNLIVCNFAFHYMCDTLAHMRALLKWNAQMLRPGGYFMFTVLDGARVFELLAPLPRGGKWSIEEDGRTKYELTKKYTGTALAAAGQTIGVLMSFADEPIDEPLCNIDAVVVEAAKTGLELVSRRSFATYLPEFARNKATMFAELSDDDKKYIELYSIVVMRRQ